MCKKYDIAIIGGGFYGCCLALYLQSNNYRVALFEKEEDILTRASAINQARVHTGFHYPRSLTTAIRSLVNFPRFAFEFKKAIVDDFIMAYAIARNGSKVNAKRFFEMYTDMHAPIKKAEPHIQKLFHSGMVEDVFSVKEYAFDHDIIRQIFWDKLKHTKVDCHLSTDIASATQKDADTIVLTDTSAARFEAKHIFNCTYSRINTFLHASELTPISLKHEITEMALVRPPQLLENLAVTVMDGPFFSLMPYPARQMYTLSHVRYTPHTYWLEPQSLQDPHKIFEEYTKKSTFPLMRNDVRRFMPDLDLNYEESIFEVKTVLQKNEHDDGRPIFFMSHEGIPQVHTVMGSKIDNVYDLFERLHEISSPFVLSKSPWEKLLGCIS